MGYLGGRYAGRVVGILLGATGGYAGMVFGLLAGWMVDEYRNALPYGARLVRFLRSPEDEQRPAVVLLMASCALMAEALARSGPVSDHGVRAAAALPWRWGTPHRRQALIRQALVYRRLIAVDTLGRHVRHIAREDCGSIVELLCAAVAPEYRHHLGDMAESLGAPLPPVALDAASCRILGVSPHADHQEVRRVYRTLAAELHPDRSAALEPRQREELQEAFIRVHTAWETLAEQFAARRL